MHKDKIAEWMEMGMNDPEVVETTAQYLVATSERVKACAMGMVLIGYYVHLGRTPREAVDDYLATLKIYHDRSEYPFGSRVISQIIGMDDGLAMSISSDHFSGKKTLRTLIDELQTGQYSLLWERTEED